MMSMRTTTTTVWTKAKKEARESERVAAQFQSTLEHNLERQEEENLELRHQQMRLDAEAKLAKPKKKRVIGGLLKKKRSPKSATPPPPRWN